MILETIRTEGLAHFSYIIGDEAAGICAVIDPRRDVDIYLEFAHLNRLRITHILETHIHADFVSGSRELSALTGAPVCGGEKGNYEFECRYLEDNEIIVIGELQLKAIHTPGHTSDPLCFLVSGGTGSAEPWGLFTGDTLFAGEVGRPDLLGGGTDRKLAEQLFQSLHEKVLNLGDEIIIYPGHGKGSPCGASIGDRQVSTIGYEKRRSPILQEKDKAQFVEKVLNSLSPAPGYYPRLKSVNAAGAPPLGHIGKPPALSPEDFRSEMEKRDTVVVDAREIEAFGGAHIAGSINIGLRDDFPIWAGWMLEPAQRILLVLPHDDKLEAAQLSLLRVGLDNIAGYLGTGIRKWIESGFPFGRTALMSIHELKEEITRRKEIQILDVRRNEEWKEGHISAARHIYLPYLEGKLQELDPSKPVAVYCRTGYRSSLASSILLRNGFRKVYNLPGSINAWLAAGYPVEMPDEF